MYGSLFFCPNELSVLTISSTGTNYLAPCCLTYLVRDCQGLVAGSCPYVPMYRGILSLIAKKPHYKTSDIM